MIGAALGVWRARWGLARLGVVMFLLWAVASDTGARLARLQLAALPGLDYAGEAARLRESGRYSEAVLIAEQGLKDLQGPDRAAVEHERILAVAERDAWMRRGAEVLRGVVLGAGPDSSLERLIGAVAADFFVVGDVRDLVIQTTRYIRGGETDGVIVALSLVGIVTTLAPEIDWAPSILKAARRAGWMSERLGASIVRAAKGRDARAIERLVEDTATIAKRSSPGAAVRLMRLADEPADLARIARYIGREGRAGAFALNATGAAGARVLRSADELRAAGLAAEAARAESLVLAAARKGAAGTAWLERGAYRALLRPHALVGVAKGVWSGRAAALVQRAIERLDPHAWWAIPLLAAWAVVELGLLLRRFKRRIPFDPKPDRAVPIRA